METFIITGIVAVIALYLAHRIKFPAIGALTIAGVILGPDVLKLVASGDKITELGELGATLLLFVVGLEVPIDKLLKGSRRILRAALVQIVGTTLLVGIFLVIFGFSINTALILGIAMSLSSTVVVLRILGSNFDLDKASSRLSIGMLIFQDIALIPFSIIIAMLGSNGGSSGLGWLNTLGLAVGYLLGIGIVGKFLLIPVLRSITALRSREVTLLTLFVICMGSAIIAEHAGLSGAFGAFIAGAVLSKSEYQNYAKAEALPFRDIFGAIFFISIGMVFDLDTFMKAPGILLICCALLIIVKFMVAGFGARVGGYSVGISFVVGSSLAQVGEFAFVILAQAAAKQIISQEDYQNTMAVSIGSIILAPWVMNIGAFLSTQIGKRDRAEGSIETSERKHHGHVILVGYGPVNRELALTLKRRENPLPVLIIESNGRTVRRLLDSGVPALYGDCRSPDVLRSAGVLNAKLLVVSVSDREAALLCVEIARNINPYLSIVVRVDRLADKSGFERFKNITVVCGEELSIAGVTGNATLALETMGPQES